MTTSPFVSAFADLINAQKIHAICKKIQKNSQEIQKKFKDFAKNLQKIQKNQKISSPFRALPTRQILCRLCPLKSL